MLTYLRAGLLIFLLASMAAGEELPGFSSVDSSFSISGQDSAGHLSLCVMDRKDIPVACFGLTKKFKQPGQYTFFVLFKLDPKKDNRTGSMNSQFEALAEGTKYDATFDVGEQEIDVKILRKIDKETGTTLDQTIQLGDQKLTKEGPRVFLLDVTGDKPVFKPLKAKLPTSVPNLADQDNKTWGAAIDKAVEEVKAQLK